MKTPFEQLKSVTDLYYSSPTKENKRAVFAMAFLLLSAENIRPRNNKDNFHIDSTISIPKSKPECIVFGLRYKKLNHFSDYSEDHFIFEKSSLKIQKGKGKWLEKLLPEYKGTHKRNMWIDILEANEEIRKGKTTDKLQGFKIKKM